MEVDDVQTQQPSRKLPRFSDDAAAAAGELSGRANHSGGEGERMNNNRSLRSTWNPSSRIVRVSKASGGKDRHSKVLTSKGLRDRRIRLSVSTAIEFYDLQDRLGLDQPSKAVEWLLQAAAEAMADLPSINPFPDGLSDERMASNGGNNEQGLGNLEGQNQNQTLSLSKSACSSTSETSKNSSALSLSRSEIRGKARERARDRTAKEKEKERENDVMQAPTQIQPQSSFTQLLTGCFNNHHDDASPTDNNHNRHWTGTCSSSVEYFSPVQLIPSSSSPRTHQVYNGQIHVGNAHLPHFPPFTISGENHHHHHHHQEPLQNQHFSFVPPETLIQTAGSTATADYNTLNFSISSPAAVGGGGGGIAGYSRGTLQSNSPSIFLNNNNNIQRFSSSSTTSSASSSSPMDSQSVSFFMATPPLEHHHHSHQNPVPFDGRLYLYYGGDGSRCSDHKQGKGRS